MGWICFAAFVVIVGLTLFRLSTGWKTVPMGLIVKLIAACVIFLVLFYLSTNLVREFGTSKNLMDYLTVFLGVPISSFDMFVTDPVSNASNLIGQETFGRLYNFLSKLGFDFGYVSTALEYRYAGFNASGNVYTFFRRPLSDFGLLGMLLFTVGVVAIFSLLYYRAVHCKWTKGMNYSLLFYGYFANIFVLASVDNELIQMFQPSEILQCLILVLVARYAVKERFVHDDANVPQIAAATTVRSASDG